MPIEQFIVTDRPRGKGLDPNESGYQAVASSPGLDAAARTSLDFIRRAVAEEP